MTAASVSWIGGIELPAPEFERLARARQDQLVKPRGALGKLEDVACWFAARQERIVPRALVPAITVFVADHGVARHGVSAFPQSVTVHMVRGLSEGFAAINVLARAIDARLTVVDLGVNQPSSFANVRDERIGSGTADLLSESAMTETQAFRALAIGAKYAREAIAAGSNLLIAGEVGIANTTSAACLIAALLAMDPTSIVGRGSGIDEPTHAHKLDVVRRALARGANRSSAIDTLREFGGFEIAAMAGFYLEAARQRTPALLDGFISAAAALLGCTLDSGLQDWLLASHRSAERGHAAALQRLRLTPLVELDMRLGEGTGAALVVPLLQNALKLHADMATFAQSGVPDQV
jgi:nicotinate-nucleotide--dimethylbenzimidazole phosphoribosyltransferase